MNVKFIGWDRKLPELAAEEFAKFANDDVPDFSTVCIVTQTRQSGRRFKMALAKHFPNGFFPPLCVTPDFFLNTSDNAKNIPNRFDLLFIWVETIKQAPEDIIKTLKLRREQNLDALINIAYAFCELRKGLAENSLTIKIVAEKTGELEEPERWKAMAKLENLYLERLQRLGFQDPQEQKISLLPALKKLKNTQKIILLALCDPIPLVVNKIEKLSNKIEIEVWINAPDELKEYFDKWGRPIPEKWENSHIDIELKQIHLAGNLLSQAEITAQKFSEIYGIQGQSCAVVLLNPDLFTYLENSFLKRGLTVYSPVAINISSSSVFFLLESFYKLLLTGSFEDFAKIARSSAYLKFLARSIKDFSAIEFLKELDDFQKKFLPRHLYWLEGKAPTQNINNAIAKTKELINEFKNSTLSAAIKNLLVNIFSTDDSVTDNGEDLYGIPAFEDVVMEIKTAIAELKDSELEKHPLTTPEKFLIFLKGLKDTKLHPIYGSGSLPLSGWLEAEFEDADNMILCGMNEGLVPEPPSSDIFLPDSLREKLGLRNNRQRFARDAYLLRSLFSPRKNGSIHLIVGKTGKNEEPLLPSRLLFLCDSTQMILRAKKLFGQSFSTKNRPISATVQWKLKIQEKVIPKSLSVSDFKSYISCPLRFYLKKVLRMETLDDEKMEFDALDFGNIMHSVLERFAKNRKISNSHKRDEIRDFLFQELKTLINNCYEYPLHVNVMLQLETMKSRLAKFAEIQAEENNKGWKIIESEFDIESEIDGVTVKGRIDRIEKSSDGEKIRILDYKSSDNAKAPEKTHCARFSDKTPNFCRINDSNEAWQELQLPLYVGLLQKKIEFKDKKIICGYFNLPKAIQESGIEEWNLEATKIASAETCAKQIIEKIRAGIFWPPADGLSHDDFKDLFSGKIEDFVEMF